MIYQKLQTTLFNSKYYKRFRETAEKYVADNTVFDINEDPELRMLKEKGLVNTEYKEHDKYNNYLKYLAVLYSDHLLMLVLFYYLTSMFKHCKFLLTGIKYDHIYDPTDDEDMSARDKYVRFEYYEAWIKIYKWFMLIISIILVIILI